MHEPIRRPRRLIASAAAVLGLLTAMEAASYGSGLATPAHAASNLYAGYQIPDGSGTPGASWIGSYRVSGREVYCADPLKGGPSTGGTYGSPAAVSTWTSTTGRRASAAQVQVAAYILGRYGATTTATAAAAVDAAVYYELFNSSGGYDYRYQSGRGGQRLAQTGSGSAISASVQVMVNAAVKYGGPYKVALSVSGGTSPGQNAVASVRLISASGAAVPSTKFTIKSIGAGGGSWTVTTNAYGIGTVSMPAAHSGTHSLTATATAIDSRLHVSAPSRSTAQRVLLAGQTTSVSGTAAFVTAAIPGVPGVSTVSSSATVAPGAALSDIVTVSDVSASYSGRMLATLFGPFESAPTAASCTPATAFGSVEMKVDHSGIYTTPALRPKVPGYYVWTESLPAGTGQQAVTTPCGLVTETTLVREPVGTLLLHKQVRGSGSNLAGARYVLTDCNGHTSATLPQTDSRGVAQLVTSPGTYCLVEVLAPPGYLVDARPVRVTIPSGGKVTASVQDSPVVAELPKTGGGRAVGVIEPERARAVGLGAFVMTALVLVTVILRRKWL